MNKTIKLYWLLGLLAFITGCVPQSTATPVPVAEAATATQKTPTQTNTPPPPTSTPTLPPSATPTPPPTKTPTSTPSPTATEEPAALTMDQNAICRSGPGTVYDVVTYLVEGAQADVEGRIEDDSWWLIQPPEAEAACWVSAEIVSVRGDLEGLPVLTPPPLPTLSPTPTLTSAGVYYILIAENTGGPLGCGDGLIKFYPGILSHGGFEDDIKTALNALFSNHSEYYNGLYNPLYKSDLRAKSVELDASNTPVIQLGGTFVKPKDECESKRMHAQVWYTVAQFSSKRAIIFLNNALLGDLMVVSNK
ncbi:MAG: hypothetical protein KJ638_00080 [Chloroflexi bacterium]|nr:hypothetical protein [Chloroflexota bacterium]